MTGIRIQMRRGTAAQWASVNPVLAAGEWGLDTTNKLVKIGDGASTWSQLTVADPKAHAATHASAGGDPVTLAQSQITNLTTDLAGKAASVHSHAQSDVTGLVSDLAGKAASVHSHAQSDVTGLDTALSGKASTTHASTHAPAGSDPLTVAQSQVTGLPADLAARVTGPASSTDNTLPRFDLATGKVLQGSGVTVDDSNNISGLGTVAGTGLAGSLLSSASPVMDGVAAAGTGSVPSRQDHVHPSDTSRAALSGATFTGDVVVSKATPTVTVSGSGVSTLISNSTSTHADVTARSASGGYARVNLDRPAGQFGAVFFKTAASQRWLIAANGDSESGSNAGTNLQITAYDDAGTALFSPLVITRATGKTTFGSVGASAGIEYGTNGPRDMVGTGSPEGVVTAPVGSTWRDTNATTGAIKWIKASGTGNTGWVVEYGDTKERNLAAVALENGWAVASSVFLLRRTGSVVSLTIGATKTSATSDIIYTLPSGFRPPSSFYAVSSSATDDYANASVSSGGLLILSRTYMTVATHYLSLTYQTSDPWPSVLPGT